MMKKGQIQTTETIFAVFLIIVIIVLGMVFYFRVMESSLKEDISRQRVLRLITIAHSVSSWPELECSTLESHDFDCIDSKKLDVINSFVEEKKASDDFSFRYYNDLLRRSTIVVTQIYPMPENTYVIYNNSLNGTKEAVTVPVNIYDPINQTFSFAIMELAVYE